MIACRPKPACGPKPFRVSTDALMLFDNPFFTCELRQHRRRRSRVVFQLLAGVGMSVVWLLVLLLIGLTLHLTTRMPFRPAVTDSGGLVLLHALGCLAAGGNGGDLVFGRDIRLKTFPALRLLPMRPEHFVARRIAFPVYIVGVVWSAGAPLYVLAVLLNLASFSEALRGFLITGWSGLMALTLTLLGTSREKAPSLAAEEKWRRNFECACRSFLVIGAGFLTMMLGFCGWSTPDRWAFFGLRLSVWLPGGLLSGVLALVTARHGRELLADDVAASPMPALVGLTTCYLLLLGVFWDGLPFWGRCLTVVVPVLLAVLSLRHLHQLTKPGPELTAAVSNSQRKEDAWTQGELEWIASHWGNPLLLRDLRASLRTHSLRRKLLNSVISQPIFLVVYYFLVKWFGSSILGGSISWLFTPLLNGGGTASVLWGKEKTSGTLPLLLLTPLSSREILAGRLVNSILVTLPTIIVPFLALIGGGVWLASTRFWPFGSAAFSILPIFLSASVAIACSNSTSSQGIPGFQSNTTFRLVQTGMLLLLPGGFAAVLAAARSGPLLCNGLALFISGLYLGFAVLVFREYERKLEAYRRADVDPAAI